MQVKISIEPDSLWITLFICREGACWTCRDGNERQFLFRRTCSKVQELSASKGTTWKPFCLSKTTTDDRVVTNRLMVHVTRCSCQCFLGDSPSDPDGVCAMFAVLWRFGEADVSMFVDPALIDEEVLVNLHNSCKNEQVGRSTWISHTQIWLSWVV